MQKDAELLANIVSLNTPLLHLYEWEGNCLTYGYFMDPYKHLDKKALQKHKILLARRPTGGGIIFHLTDFAFSLFIPASHPHFSLNTLENYAYVNGLILQIIAPLLQSTTYAELLQTSTERSTFCMAQPTQYDLICKGKKLGGAAQRRTKAGLLHQGSISLAIPPLDILQEVLKNDLTLVEAMQKHSYMLCSEINQLHDMRQAIKELLKAAGKMEKSEIYH